MIFIEAGCAKANGDMKGLIFLTVLNSLGCGSRDVGLPTIIEQGAEKRRGGMPISKEPIDDSGSDEVGRWRRSCSEGIKSRERAVSAVAPVNENELLEIVPSTGGYPDARSLRRDPEGLALPLRSAGCAS